MFVAGALSMVACGDDDGDDDIATDGALADAAPSGDGATPADAGPIVNGGGGDGGQGDPGPDIDSGADGALPSADASGDAALFDAAPADDATPGGDAGECAAGCDDNVDCTVDSCIQGRCVHLIDDGLCQAGSSCDLTRGCQQGGACSVAGDCADADGCTANERCDATSMRCVWDPLDLDADGYAPASCGGTDCDDRNGLIGPSATETCDGVDNDCDGVVDDQATCGAGRSCVNGACTCSAGFDQCLGSCVDLQTDQANCGACGTSCGAGGVCTGGACSCPAPAMECGGSCVDLQTSMTHCGACDAACAVFGEGGQLQGCLGGNCVACGREGQPCCRLTGCSGALTCRGTQGAADSACECPSGAAKCGDANTCTDLSADESNCGGCGVACGSSEVCQTRGDQTSCVACGGLGEPCCDGFFGFGTCGGGNACGPNRTCVRANVPVPPDAGSNDGGVSDAGADAGSSDAGQSDAGSDDAGQPDAGLADAG